MRKSLLVADQFRGGLGFRCWRPSASSPRSNSSPAAGQTKRATRTPATSPGAKPTSWPCGTAPASARRYEWFDVEFANLRAAFRWAADHDDLDVAAAIATYTALLGTFVENFEPIAWAEELIEPARAVDHPRLAALYVMASQCYLAGRLDAAIRYSEAGQRVLSGGRDEVHGGIGGLLVSVYVAAGQAERAIEWYRAEIARGRDTPIFTTIALCLALATAGRPDEAMVAANGLVDAAEATRNPLALSYAFFVVGFAFGDADPDRAREALRRGLVIAQESGNRANESHLAAMLCRLEAAHGDTLAAFDYLTLAIRNYHDAGNTVTIRVPLAVLAAVFDRLGRYEPAQPSPVSPSVPLPRRRLLS